jgi:hypothetical protein
VNFSKIIDIKPSSNVYYGQYINGNKHIYDLMMKLTNGTFKFGVNAQEILFHSWKKGKLLTYKQLAKFYIEYKPREHPEWQYIDYIRKNGTKIGWDKFRQNIAVVVINYINSFN